jgi:hypothetical protein
MPAASGSMKNFGLSAAGTDLGLGADLQDQVSQESDEQRKKRLMAGLMSPAASTLLGQQSGLGGH